MNANQDALERAFALGEVMLEAARTDSWDSIVAAETERSALLAHEHPAGPGSAQWLVRLIEQNQALHDLALRARDEVGRQLGVNRQNHRAATAYLSINRD
jgi:Flagellar protein FliT